MDFLILIGLLLALAIVGPPLWGLIIWVNHKLKSNPLSLEDAVTRGYETAYGDGNKKL